VLDIEHTLGADPRFATNRARNEHRAELVPELQEILETRDAADWLEKFLAAEIPAGPINTVSEALADPQTRARGMIVEIEHPLIGIARSVGNPIHASLSAPTYRLPPPRLGEHTREILERLEIGEVEIQELEKNGVV
jgi:crotonobetainyl-CoA:carnitine CoA-transferase CaiB-like acyl-CoA transferase